MRNLMRQSQQWPVSSASAFPEDVRQVFNQFFNDEDRDGSSVVTSQWAPRVDIKEEAERFLILADLPGIDPQDVEVLMDKGILSIKGERKDETREEGDKFSRIERRYGSFHRRFALPDSADADGVTAAGSNGVLEISIPKRAESTPRRIQVGAGAK